MACIITQGATYSMSSSTLQLSFNRLSHVVVVVQTSPTSSETDWPIIINHRVERSAQPLTHDPAHGSNVRKRPHRIAARWPSEITHGDLNNRWPVIIMCAVWQATAIQFFRKWRRGIHYFCEQRCLAMSSSSHKLAILCIACRLQHAMTGFHATVLERSAIQACL